MTDVEGVLEQYEPYDVDRAGSSGVSHVMVRDIIQSIAGKDALQDGTGVRKVHSHQVNANLAPEVDMETAASIVQAFERLNLTVHAKDDRRFSGDTNPRALRVQRKRSDPETSTWWDTTGADPRVDGGGEDTGQDN